MFKKNKSLESGITLIEANCEITGDLHFSDQLQGNGLVKGTYMLSLAQKLLSPLARKGKCQARYEFL